MIRGLLLLCGLLAGVIGAEVVYGTGSSASAPVGVEQAKGASAHALNSAGVQARSSEQWLSVVLGRPLFAPNRRPEVGASAIDPGLPRLSGIIVSVGGSVAIFQGTGDGKAVVARSGGTVDGWALTRISADAVDLQKASKTIVLRPRFETASASGRNAEPPVPRSRWEAPAAKGLLPARWSNPQLQP